jgi:hypothetical protein
MEPRRRHHLDRRPFSIMAFAFAGSNIGFFAFMCARGCPQKSEAFVFGLV